MHQVKKERPETPLKFGRQRNAVIGERSEKSPSLPRSLAPSLPQLRKDVPDGARVCTTAKVSCVHMGRCPPYGIIDYSSFFNMCLTSAMLGQP